ncbi:MAG TPA: carboxypeptidase regulatory-like domain-containing protein, partial [Candidatus Wallbacteria bacterium]|nr:carboxypeptidase regulatory-like domain-containing protein [Candidatus Wallbacteria bacterium]
MNPTSKTIAIFLLFFVHSLLSGCFGNQNDNLLTAQSNGNATGFFQTGRGSLSGYIVSESYNSLNSPERALTSTPNVQVSLLENGSFAFTNQAGYFEFNNIPPGTYTLIAKRNDPSGIKFINTFSADVIADKKNEIRSSLSLKKSAAIEGRIKTSDNADASSFTITVEDLPAYTQSASYGYFSLDEIPSSQTIYIKISKSGYKTRRYGPFNLLEGQKYFPAEDILIETDGAAGALLSGKITDSKTGNAIDKVFIRAYDAASGTKLPDRAVYSDINGNYSFSITNSKKYTLEFSKENYYTYTRTFTAGAESAFYIDASLSASISGSSYYTITGRIYAIASGQSVANARIYTRPSAGSSASDQSGKYSLTLPAGSYTLSTACYGYGDSKVTINVDPAEGAVTSEVDIGLSSINGAGPYQVFG